MKLQSIKIKLINSAGWIFSISFMYIYVYHRDNLGLSESGKFALRAVGQTAWSFSVCWIAFASHKLKTGGIVRWFLSHHFWQPLSNICLSVYLIHMFYLYSSENQIREKSSFGAWWQIQIHVADIVFVTLIGAMFYLLIEAPTSNLLSILWKQKHFRFDRNKDKSSHEIERKALITVL